MVPKVDQALERRLDGIPLERVKQALAGDGGGVDHVLIQIPGRLTSIRPNAVTSGTETVESSCILTVADLPHTD